MEEIRQILAGLDWSPVFHFNQNRNRSNDRVILPGNMGSKKGAESEDGSQGCAGWDSDTAAGASADGCRIFPAAHFQYEKNRWIVSLYDI